MEYDILKTCEGFDWDKGNELKNSLKHFVSKLEAEEIFFNIPLIVATSDKHDNKEIRYFALGKTNHDRKLFIAFTVRGKLMRVISARDMSKKERQVYEKNS